MTEVCTYHTVHTIMTSDLNRAILSTPNGTVAGWLVGPKDCATYHSRLQHNPSQTQSVLIQPSPLA